MRIYGKGNYNSTRPLDSYLGEKAELAITSLEQLFNVYWKIEQYRTELKRRDEIKKAYAKARKLEFLP